MRKSRFRSFIGGAAAIAIATGMAIGVPIVKKTVFGGSGGTVLGTVFFAPNGNDTTCGRSSTPVTFANAAGHICQTPAKAFSLHVQGDQIVGESGSYGFTALDKNVSDKGTAITTVVPDTGATITLAGGQFGDKDGSSSAIYTTLKGVNLTELWTFGTQSTHDTLDGVTANSTSVDMTGGSFDTYKNSTTMNCDAGPQPTYDLDCAMRMIGTNQTIDNVVFHDIYQSDNIVPPGTDIWHTEAVFIRGCQTCTIKNSTFYNIDSSSSVFVQDCCGLSANDTITIVNNWFGPHLNEINPLGGQFTDVLCFTCEPKHDAISLTRGQGVNTGFPNVIIAFNSAYDYCDTSLSTTYLTATGGCGGFLSCDTGPLAADPQVDTYNCGTPTNNAQVYGNLFTMPSVASGGNPANCTGYTTYQYNVFYPFNQFNGENGPCPGTGNVLRTSGLFPYTLQSVGSAMATTAPNYTIPAGAATWEGDEHVPAALCANFPTDKNGNSRNDGNGCDNGATER